MTGDAEPESAASEAACGEPAPADAARSECVVKRSIVIAGHRTSVSLEQAFWDALKAIASEEGISLAALAARVDAARRSANLSSALRVYAFRRAARLSSQKENARKGHEIRGP